MGLRRAARVAAGYCGGRQGLELGIAAGGKRRKAGVLGTTTTASCPISRSPPSTYSGSVASTLASAAMAEGALRNGTIKPCGDRRQRLPQVDLETPSSTRTTSVEIWMRCHLFWPEVW